MASTHSHKNAQFYLVWSIILLNYNLPPWLTIKKKHFIMLSMLIPGPNLVTSVAYWHVHGPHVGRIENVVDHGCTLLRHITLEWQGMIVMMATLMWMIHDFPTFVMIVRCLICSPHTKAGYWTSLTIFVCGRHHRWWLPFKHTFCHDSMMFLGIEEQVPPPYVSGIDHWRWAFLRSKYMRMGVVEGGGECKPKCTLCKIKRLPTTYSLPY